MRRGAPMIAAALALAPVLVLAGCATAPEPRAAPGAAPRAAIAPRAEQLAEALLRADRAEQRRDSAALAEAAMRLDRLDPRPETADDDVAQRRWLAGLPADAVPMRGRALGPAWRSVLLQPGAATQLSQTFFGGRSAQIAVRVAQGAAPVLMVRDQSEREVCRADRDPVNCRWMPLYTQRHRIEIVNKGREVSRIYIVFD